MITQTLALINNYICTKQEKKALSTLKLVKKICSEHKAYEFFDKNKPCEIFGKNWQGENLDNKSLEIFCDHGMGDTVMMFRYIKELKNKYNVKIILNCLLYKPFKRLMDNLDFIDVFTNEHNGCDYHTNIMQLPKMYHGKYLWKEILEGAIPEQPLLLPLSNVDFYGKKIAFGLKYNSNVSNNLHHKKSIPAHEFYNINCCPLEPESIWVRYVEEGDIADLVSVMSSLPLIVSVDTLTLHLAGSMELPTIGLLAYDADPRWGKEDKTPWYPSVILLRQLNPGEWKEPLEKLWEMVDVEESCW